MKRSDIDAFFARLARQSPAPKGELDSRNPYTLLVAVVLSAQATDASVNKATEKLFAVADTPQKMLALGEAGLREHIRAIGLYNSKAKNIIALSRLLLEHHGGKVPDSRAALESLPGVGRKSASVILNAAFERPTIAVDTHVFRVCNRTGLAPGRSPLETERLLERRVPEHWKANAHFWLILHGRYVCKARRPDCPNCVVRDLCAYRRKTVAEAQRPRLRRSPRQSRPSASSARRSRIS